MAVKYVLSIQLKTFRDLIYSTFHFALQDETNQDFLDLWLPDVELLSQNISVLSD